MPDPNLLTSAQVIQILCYQRSHIYRYQLTPSKARSTATSEARFTATTSARWIFVSGSLWECLEVVGPEYQGGQIPECTGLMQWPSGAPGSTGDEPRWTWKVW